MSNFARFGKLKVRVTNMNISGCKIKGVYSMGHPVVQDVYNPDKVIFDHPIRVANSKWVILIICYKW